MPAAELTLQRGIIAFWALYLSVVFFSNLFDLLKHVGALGGGWKFASGNYQALRDATRIYGLRDGAVLALFAAVVAWEALASALLWGALLQFNGRAASLEPVYLGFGASMALWAAFLLADELLIEYERESAHWRMLTGQVASLVLVLALMPG